MALGGNNLYNDAGRGELTADDYNAIASQKRQVAQQYALGTQQNSYQRSSAAAEYQRQRQRVLDSYAQRFGELQAPYAQRGLLNSGLYAQGVDRFNQARNQEIGDLTAAYNERVGALNLSDQQLGSVFGYGMDEAETAGAARRASVAEELRRARQGL